MTATFVGTSAAAAATGLVGNGWEDTWWERSAALSVVRPAVGQHQCEVLARAGGAGRPLQVAQAYLQDLNPASVHPPEAAEAGGTSIPLVTADLPAAERRAQEKTLTSSQDLALAQADADAYIDEVAQLMWAHLTDEGYGQDTRSRITLDAIARCDEAD